MSEIVAISPKLQAAMQEIYDNSKRNAIDSYLDMIRSLSKMPEDQLVEGALNLARDRANGQDIGMSEAQEKADLAGSVGAASAFGGRGEVVDDDLGVGVPAPCEAPDQLEGR